MNKYKDLEGIGCGGIIFVYLFALLLGFGLAILGWGVIVWLLVWALHGIGIYTIGTFVVAFSWKLVIVIALIFTIIRSLFSSSVTVKKD